MRAALLCCLLLASAAPARGQTTAFPDVPPGHWAAESVGRAAEAGLLRGLPDGRFHGPRVVTRAELAVALQRLLAEFDRRAEAGEAPRPLPPALEPVTHPAAPWTGHVPFPDVGPTSLCWSELPELVRLGVFRGFPEGVFTGREATTRYELAAVLDRLLAAEARLRAALPAEALARARAPVFAPASALVGEQLGLPAGHWAHMALAEGYGQLASWLAPLGEAPPGEGVTRYELAAVLGRAWLLVQFHYRDRRP